LRHQKSFSLDGWRTLGQLFLIRARRSRGSRGRNSRAGRLSRLFRRLFLEQLTALHATGRLRFFGDHAHLAERRAFTAYLAPLRKTEWVVYSKRPFGGPEAVLAYLSLYTHRIAISNSRLVAFDDTGVTFKWNDYRARGRERAKLMTLAIDEFIRRFLIHVLPGGFHRIRYYGLLANGGRAENIARARRLLNASAPQVAHSDAGGAEQQSLSHPCPCCGGRMIVIETFARGPRHYIAQQYPTRLTARDRHRLVPSPECALPLLVVSAKQ
jgi:hypothetical protein